MRLMLCATVLAAVQLSTAHASLLRFEFSGTIVASYPSSGGVKFDIPYSGFFVLDSRVPDAAPVEWRAVYEMAVVDASMIVGNVQWDIAVDSPASGIFNAVLVDNNNNIGHDQIQVASAMRDPDGDLHLVLFDYSDPTGQVLSDTSFPTAIPAGFAPFDLIALHATRATFFGPSLGPDIVQGPIEFARIRPVPVPAAAWLFAGALCVFWPGARRRRRPGGSVKHWC